MGSRRRMRLRRGGAEPWSLTELVENGDFSDGTTDGWTPSVGDFSLSVSNGALRARRGANINQYVYQEVDGLEVGQEYLLQFEFVALSDNNDEFMDVRFGTSLAAFDIRRWENLSHGEEGFYSHVFTATTSSVFLRFLLRNGSNGDWFEIDNISLVPFDNLVENGDASSGTTGWTDTGDATLSVVSDEFVLTRGSNVNQYFFQEIAVVPGRPCTFNFDFVGLSTSSGAYLDARVGSTQGGIDFARFNNLDAAETGTKAASFTPDSSSVFVAFFIRDGSNGDSLTVDNVRLVYS